MAIPVFPSLPGLAYPVKRSASFDTVVQEAISGRRTGFSQRITPKWTWELSFDVLRTGAGFAEMQTLAGFYMGCFGRALPFAYTDAEDNAVVDQLFATTNGTAKSFQLIRALGGFNEPVYLPTGAITVKENGITLNPANYSISKGVVGFPTARPAGRTLTWTGGFNWLCRFDEDGIDFSNFMNFLWGVETVSFSSEVA